MLQTNHRVTDRVKPLRGLIDVNAPNTQGAPRDPGLWSETPSAFCRKSNRTAATRTALTLIEVVASTMIVGLMAVAALNTLGAATRSSMSIGNRAVAQGLADDLMSEILATDYLDPNDLPAFGPEGAESSGPRSVFDDVDDYDELDELPPRGRDDLDNDGNLDPMPDRDDWRRLVTVEHVDPEDPTVSLPDNDDQGAKRITVTIKYKGQQLAEQVAVRTDTDPSRPIEE